MTLDSFNSFTVTVTPKSVLWKYKSLNAMNCLLILMFCDPVNNIQEMNSIFGMFMDNDGIMNTSGLLQSK